MTKREEIEELQSKIKRLENAQKICKHEWEDPIYNPRYETGRVKCGSEYRGNLFIRDLYEEKTTKIDRWERTCKLCGKIEYTEKQHAVEYAPEF